MLLKKITTNRDMNKKTINKKTNHNMCYFLGIIYIINKCM